MGTDYLISNLIESIDTKKIITITNKNSKRDFLHVDDFINIIIKIKDYDCKFEIFNVGSGVSYSFNEIIKIIEDITSKKLNLKIFIQDIIADISKIKKIIKWSPKLSLQKNIENEL